MAKRPCAQPGCPTITDRARCDTHEREHDKARGTSTARGYGSAHQRHRAAWQARIDAGERVTCWRCGVTLTGTAWDDGHDPLDRDVYRGPECIPCNRATRKGWGDAP